MMDYLVGGKSPAPGAPLCLVFVWPTPRERLTDPGESADGSVPAPVSVTQLPPPYHPYCLLGKVVSLVYRLSFPRFVRRGKVPL